jgi:hypothetical protein
MIRFGGPGAPCFVLKCFSTTLASVSCNDEDASQVIKRNTRLNAIGRTQQQTPCRLPAPDDDAIFESLMVDRKRSFDSLSSTGSLEMEVPDCKRMRCSSPPMSPEEPLRLVSPDPPTVKCCRRVTFSMDPPQYFYPVADAPDISSSDEDEEEDVNSNNIITNNSSWNLLLPTMTTPQKRYQYTYKNIQPKNTTGAVWFRQRKEALLNTMLIIITFTIFIILPIKMQPPLYNTTNFVPTRPSSSNSSTFLELLLQAKKTRQL